MLKRLFRSAVLMALAFAFVSALHAEEKSETKADDAIGSVIAVKGKVTATDSSGKTRDLKLKGNIFRQDTVATGKRGKMQMMFDDNTIVSLGRDSDMKISEYEFKPKENKGKMVTEVKKGVFRVMGGKITKIAPDKFKTKTKTATIGIRGSMYGGTFNGSQLKVAFLGGKGITVGNGQGMVLITKPSFGTVVNPGAPPAPPRMFSPFELGAMNPSEGAPPPPGEGGGQSEGDQPPTEGDAPPPDGTDDTPEGDAPPPEGDLDGGLDDPGIVGDIGDGDLGDTPLGDGFDAGTGELVGEVLDGVNDLVNDGLQGDLGDSTGVELGIDEGGVVSGLYFGVLIDKSSFFGAISATKDFGNYNGSAITSNGTFPVEITGLPLSTTSNYTGPTELTFIPGRSVPLSTGALTLQKTRVNYDNFGDFIVFESEYSNGLTGAGEVEYNEIGFMGKPTLSMPTDGVAFYGGGMVAAAQDTTQGTSFLENEDGKFDVAINFRNGTVIGFFDAKNDDAYTDYGFFYGKLSGNTITNVKMLTFGTQDDAATTPQAVQSVGTATFGTIYGRVYQGVGFSGIANGSIIATDSAIGSLQVTGAAHRDVSQSTSTAATGSVGMTGFFVGMAEKINGTATPLRIASSSLSDFTMTLDRDAGTVSGSLNGSFDNGISLSNVGIGGANGSACVSDRAFIAELGGTDIVVNGASKGTFKGETGILFVEQPSLQWGNYIEWGYWSAAFADPAAASNVYAVEPSAGFWVAGTQQTLTTKINELMTNEMVGRYSGGAAAVSWESATGKVNKHTGTAAIVINFSGSSLNTTVGGVSKTISGKGWAATLAMNNLNVDLAGGGGTVLSSGFSGTVDKINGSSVESSTVKGAFFGPNADSIAGNFTAGDSAGTKKYVGVFGGQVQSMSVNPAN